MALSESMRQEQADRQYRKSQVYHWLYSGTVNQEMFDLARQYVEDIEAGMMNYTDWYRSRKGKQS